MKEFIAQTRIELPDANKVLMQVCAHMVEHDAEVESHGQTQILRFRDTQANLTRQENEVLINVKSKSLEGIYFTRMALTSHILEFADGHVPLIEWDGDGATIIRPPNFQILEVLNCKNITPHMRRISFKAENIERFVSMDALHLNILVQHPERNEPQWPSVGLNGLIHWEDPQTRPAFRKYTIRSLDSSTGIMEIDFVLHADAGPGSALATQINIGDQVGVMGPGGGGLIEADWYLFAGDETALPAIARMLEHLPQVARGFALIEVADEAEIQPLTTSSAVEARWLLRHGQAAGTTSLLADAIRDIILPDDGSSLYVWAGCEFEAFRTIRSHLRTKCGLKKHEHLVVSYWRCGEETK